MPEQDDLAALERVTEDGKELIVCSCGVRFKEGDSKFIAGHKAHFDHLAPDYVQPTVI